MRQLKLIAEVKTKSPYGFVSNRSWDELFELANAVGDIVSVHMHAKWGGDLLTVKKARSLTNKPILVKTLGLDFDGVHAAISCGADHVIVHDQNVQECFEPGVAWLEFFEAKHLRYCYREGGGKRVLDPRHTYVVNSRNPFTGGDSDLDWGYVRRLHTGTLVQASKVSRPTQIYPDADAVIVGEALPEFCDLWPSLQSIQLAR